MEWKFKAREEVEAASLISVRGVLEQIMNNLVDEDKRHLIHLGNGDPSSFPCFRTTEVAEEAIISAVRSGKHNKYSPTIGLISARKAIANYLSRDLPYELSSDDIYITSGCSQAIEAVISVLARPGANILLPMPSYPFYESLASYNNLEVRHFDLLPDKNWEVNLEKVESLAIDNTVAMVIINPGNPCGNVFSYKHLTEIAETAKKLGILVIADEVYAHLVLGPKPFVPMGTFGSTVPVLTLGSISKRWVVPGWRLGWLVTTDLTGILKKTKIVSGIKAYLNISSDAVTFIQAAIPAILENTTEDFFQKTIDLLKETADICCKGLNDIPCLICPFKPEGSMFVMVRLDLSLLEDIEDDLDFCCKLAREESVLVLPGSALRFKNWVRISYGVDPSSLQDAINRIKAFCERHSKHQQEK